MPKPFQARLGQLLPLEVLADVDASKGSWKSDVTTGLYAGDMMGSVKAKHISGDS